MLIYEESQFPSLSIGSFRHVSTLRFSPTGSKSAVVDTYFIDLW